MEAQKGNTFSFTDAYVFTRLKLCVAILQHMMKTSKDAHEK